MSLYKVPILDYEYMADCDVCYQPVRPWVDDGNGSYQQSVTGFHSMQEAFGLLKVDGDVYVQDNIHCPMSLNGVVTEDGKLKSAFEAVYNASSWFRTPDKNNQDETAEAAGLYPFILFDSHVTCLECYEKQLKAEKYNQPPKVVYFDD